MEVFGLLNCMAIVAKKVAIAGLIFVALELVEGIGTVPKACKTKFFDTEKRPSPKIYVSLKQFLKLF